MGKLTVEQNGVKGDAKDIAQLFKEAGVDFGQFLKKDSNIDGPTNVPGWVCIVLFVVLCGCSSWRPKTITIIMSKITDPRLL